MEKALRRKIIKYQNKTGVNKYDARRIIENTPQDEEKKGK